MQWYSLCMCTCKYCYHSWADFQYLLHGKANTKYNLHVLNSLHRHEKVLISSLTERSSLLNRYHWFYAEIPQASWILSRRQHDLLHHIPKALSN